MGSGGLAMSQKDILARCQATMDFSKAKLMF
jgi:hypothetical protein